MAGAGRAAHRAWATGVLRTGSRRSGAFAELGRALIGARGTGEALDAVGVALLVGSFAGGGEIVGRTYREAARACEAQLGDETAAVREALRAFAELGTALMGARDTGERALDPAILDPARQR